MNDVIETMNDVYCHLRLPTSVQLNANQVEHALNTFFQQHPEVLDNIFMNSESHPENREQRTQVSLPYITKEKRDKILLSLMEESDDDSEDIDINEIKSARHSKNEDDYNFSSRTIENLHKP